MTHPAQDALTALDKIAIFARTGCQMCPNALNSLVDTVKAGIQSASREWHDISEAPKNGNEFWAWRRGEIATARWYKNAFGEEKIGYIGWSYPEGDMPTHFMLPTPPKQENERGN